MNSEKPLVSIVMPVFNAEAFLADAINSCLHQSYRPIEIICADNNSIDESAVLLKRYEKNHPQVVKVIEEKQAGAPAARNKGMAVSRGEFIYFLDSDDALLPNAVKSLVAGMEPGIDAVSGSESYYSNDFENLPVHERKRIRNIDYQLADILNDHPNTGAVLLRKSAIQDVKWDNSLGAGQELVFLSEVVITKNVKIKYISETVCKIRIHSSPYRISNQKRKIKAEIHYRAIMKIEMLLQSSPFKSELAEIALNDRKLRNAFNAIHEKNFKVSYLLSRRINKKLVKKSTSFKWLSREGIFCVSNLYAAFIFYFLNYKVLEKINFFFK